MVLKIILIVLPSSLFLRRMVPKSASRTTVANGSSSTFIQKIRRPVEPEKPTSSRWINPGMLNATQSC
jgi:hypothetical protein